MARKPPLQWYGHDPLWPGLRPPPTMVWSRPPPCGTWGAQESMKINENAMKINEFQYVRDLTYEGVMKGPYHHTGGGGRWPAGPGLHAQGTIPSYRGGAAGPEVGYHIYIYIYVFIYLQGFPCRIFRVGGRGAVLQRPRVFQQKLKVTYFYDVFRILFFVVQEARKKGGVGG